MTHYLSALLMWSACCLYGYSSVSVSCSCHSPCQESWSPCFVHWPGRQHPAVSSRVRRMQCVSGAVQVLALDVTKGWDCAAKRVESETSERHWWSLIWQLAWILTILLSLLTLPMIHILPFPHSVSIPSFYSNKAIYYVELVMYY